MPLTGSFSALPSRMDDASRPPMPFSRDMSVMIWVAREKMSLPLPTSLADVLERQQQVRAGLDLLVIDTRLAGDGCSPARRSGRRDVGRIAHRLDAVLGDRRNLLGLTRLRNNRLDALDHRADSEDASEALDRRLAGAHEPAAELLATGRASGSSTWPGLGGQLRPKALSCRNNGDEMRRLLQPSRHHRPFSRHRDGKQTEPDAVTLDLVAEQVAELRYWTSSRRHQAHGARCGRQRGASCRDERRASRRRIRRFGSGVRRAGPVRQVSRRFGSGSCIGCTALRRRACDGRSCPRSAGQSRPHT